jgi:hypothetical protein
MTAIEKDPSLFPKGWQANAGGLTYKVHLHGYNMLPYLEGKALDEAQAQGWTVVHGKTDWKRFFPCEP